MGVRLRPALFFGVLAAGVVALACNAVTGVLDLDVADKSPDLPIDAGIRVNGQDGDVSSDPDGGTIDGATDATFDAADSGCPLFQATSMLGGAKSLGGTTFELTPDDNLMSGGLASAMTVPLADFDVSLSYSITYTSGDVPGSGLTFFAIQGQAAMLTCQSGPYLCTLAAKSQGYAFILRTSRKDPTDPQPPYVAVVDARNFPNQQPNNPPVISTALSGMQVATIANGIPPANTFHALAISVRQGKLTAKIDGTVVLTSVTIPNFNKGIAMTWGIGAATGEGANYAERTVVSNVMLQQCP